MKNQTQVAPVVRVESPVLEVASQIFRATLQLVLVFAATAMLMLIGCAGGPPTPPPPEDPAQAKADAKARDDFARDLPKPREH